MTLNVLQQMLLPLSCQLLFPCALLPLCTPCPLSPYSLDIKAHAQSPDSSLSLKEPASYGAFQSPGPRGCLCLFGRQSTLTEIMGTRSKQVGSKTGSTTYTLVIGPCSIINSLNFLRLQNMNSNIASQGYGLDSVNNAAKVLIPHSERIKRTWAKCSDEWMFPGESPHIA